MPKSGRELVQDCLYELEHAYDPTKAHDYYLRTRKLKGRKKGSREPAKVIPIHGRVRKQTSSKPTKAHSVPPKIQARVNHLESRLSELRGQLRKKLNDASKTKKSSHQKPTASDKTKKAREDKKYRNKHKTELANKRKAKAHKGSGGGSGGGTSSSKSVGSMSETELRSAIKRTSDQLHAAVAQARAAAKRGTA